MTIDVHPLPQRVLSSSQFVDPLLVPMTDKIPESCHENHEIQALFPLS